MTDALTTETEMQLDEAECTRRGVQIAVLKAQLYQLRAKASRQRRELRRLNKTLKALWAGARFQVNVMAEQRAKHVDVGAPKDG